MGTYDEVLAVLRTERDWSEFCSPAPDPVALALETDSAETVASKLDSAVWATVAAGLPWNVKQEDGYEWACRQSFQTGQKYWDLNTSIALGQQVEQPVDSIGKAASPTDWWSHQEMLRNRLGEKLCAQDEFDRRAKYVASVPIEWTEWNGGAQIYQLAVREGYMPVGAAGFDPAYLTTNPRLKDVRGLSATQWMENLDANDQHKPLPWAPTKPVTK